MPIINRAIALLAVFVSVLALSASAVAGTKVLTFAWEQNSADLPNLREWRLYVAEAETGPFSVLTVVPYDGQPKPEYQVSASVSLVPDGAKKTLFFTATAVATSGTESDRSNVVSHLFDFTTVTVPIRLRIVIDATGGN